VIVAFSWADRTGKRHQWAQMLRLRNGRIVDLQDYRSPTQALASARIRAAFN
jgi:hypothetical protein